MGEADELRAQLRNAMKARALVYAAVYDELEAELGAAKAEEILKRAIYKRGLAIGRQFKRFGPADIAGLRALCIEAGVNLIGCKMTVDLFGYSRDDFIPEVSEFAGAATFLPMAKDADVTLFV